MWNARLDEAQAGTEIAGKNTNSLGYADDTTLMAESKEELKSHVMKVEQETEKSGLNHIQKTKIMAFGPITSQQMDGYTMKTVTDFISSGSKSLWMVTAVMKLKDTCSLEERLWQT